VGSSRVKKKKYKEVSMVNKKESLRRKLANGAKVRIIDLIITYIRKKGRTYVRRTKSCSIESRNLLGK